MSLVHLALAFVLAHPAVTAPIIGPRTMEQLETQLGAVDVTRPRTFSIGSTRSCRLGPRSTVPTPAINRRRWGAGAAPPAYRLGGRAVRSWCFAAPIQGIPRLGRLCQAESWVAKRRPGGR